ncbi:MAG: patatin-like phospholipase family protein [Bacteroidota bacterium]
MDTNKKPVIGISLSGGGARGIAHIGVLQALAEAEIEIDIVAGASAGSIVGAMYAAGLSPQQMLAAIKESNFLKLVKFGLPNMGITKLDYLSERLTGVIPNDSFASLKKPLYVAITNANTGKLEIVSDGPLYQVLMASCCIPLLFQPIEIAGQLYIDGGILSNLPVTPIRDKADFVIGVNVVPQQIIPSDELTGFFTLSFRVFDLGILSNSRPESARCDHLIEPARLGEYGVMQFHKYEEIYQLGYDTARAQIRRIQAAIDRKAEVML